MNFNEAYENLKNGLALKRKKWESDIYITLDEMENIVSCKREAKHYNCNYELIESKEWKIIGGDGKKITFIEAIPHLKNGKCITNNEMNSSYLFIDNGNLAISELFEYCFDLQFACLSANDWEIVNG